MTNLCNKYKLNPLTLKKFINESVSLIELKEIGIKNNSEYKILKPYLDAIKDLLKNGDIKK